MKIQEIQKEVLGYIANSPDVLQAAVLSKEIVLNKYSRTITKVRGEFPTIHSLLGHVVQGFNSKKWTPYGEIQFRKKFMRNFHQKVDFTLDPAEILGTVLESKYDEGKGIKDKTISKEAIQQLLAKIIDDVQILSVDGKYDAAKVGLDNPEFGFSMDGLNEINRRLRLNTENPVFSIPGDAVTQNNILAEFTRFERGLPEFQKNKIKKIFTSVSDADDYAIAYKEANKLAPSYSANQNYLTELGKREIIGVPGLERGTIVATVENGFVKMVDLIDNPATITDVQVDKRILNVLGEFTLGYDYAINELTYMHTPDATKNRGLNNKVLNDLYYPSEKGLIAS